MQKSISILVLLLSVCSLRAQDISGQWNGLLKVQGTQLRVVFNITKTADGYTSTMDSPDQGAKDIPVTSTTFENGQLKIAVASARIDYTGEYKDDKIAGTFKQGAMSFPMDLTREKIEKQVVVRPQEPKKPYPYYAENVMFTNAPANITLAGTLTLPKKEGVFPVVILISGSGPQNRDEELLGHKPFLILSDYLTRNGIAVLRYDDRGTNESKGDFEAATSADFATDVEAAIAYLKTRKEIDPKKIGLAGHSEGGIIAPMVAARSKDVAFIVLLAGTGIPGDELLLLQSNLISKAAGATEKTLKEQQESSRGAFALVKKSSDMDALKKDMTDYVRAQLKDLPDSALPSGMTREDYLRVQVNGIVNPWMVYFIKYNPSLILPKVKCPVLALNGAKDLQVPPKENLTAIKKGLKKGKNKQVTTMELPGLNHLFQECTTGAPTEYDKIEQTMSPAVLKIVSDWILVQVK